MLEGVVVLDKPLTGDESCDTNGLQKEMPPSY
jgi:hypothetical protein